MSKFGLGRGLADINNEMGNVPNISILTGSERVVVRQIPLEDISANPDQPRKKFAEAELKELAESIKEKGVLQPILLRGVKDKPYLYEIVAGERRFRASKMAGLTKIPALVKTIDDNNVMEIALIENVQRENLNPIEEAVAYQNLIEKCQYKMEDLTRLIGKSDSYIRNIIRLTKLPESVKKLVEEGKLSASHARTIAVAENPEELAKQIIENNLSVEEIAKRVKNSARAKNSRQRESGALDLSAVRNIEVKLFSALGVKVKLREKRGGAGTITLSFINRMQMYELIEKITGKK